jgi:hypothetical protein
MVLLKQTLLKSIPALGFGAFELFAHVGFGVKRHIMARKKSPVICFTVLAHS